MLLILHRQQNDHKYVMNFWYIAQPYSQMNYVIMLRLSLSYSIVMNQTFNNNQFFYPNKMPKCRVFTVAKQLVTLN